MKHLEQSLRLPPIATRLAEILLFDASTSFLCAVFLPRGGVITGCLFLMPLLVSVHLYIFVLIGRGASCGRIRRDLRYAFCFVCLGLLPAIVSQIGSPLALLCVPVIVAAYVIFG
jgi:hypothetical protein